MKVHDFRWFTCLLLILGLTGCGGGGGGSDQTTADPKAGLIISTGNSAMPYVTLSAEGHVHGYLVDETTGKPAGLTISAVDGTEAYVAIDPDTGMARYWSYNGIVTLFENYRPDTGLVDIAVIDDSGNTEIYKDVSYLPPGASPAQASALRAAEYANAYFAFARAGSPVEKFLDTANAIGVVINASACAVSALVLGGSAATGAAVTLPVAVPLLATTGWQLAASCLSAATGLLAIRPNAVQAEIDSVTADTVARHVNTESINEMVGTGSGLYTAVGCVSNVISRDMDDAIKDCLETGVNTVSFIGSQTLRRSSATERALRTHMQQPSAEFVVCCDGPDQIRPNVQGTWKGIAMGGGQSSVNYAFDFGVGQAMTSEDIGTTTDGHAQARHVYPSPGVYMVTLSAMLTDNIYTRSDEFAVTVYDDLQVACCTASGSLHSDGTSFLTGTEIALGIEVSGGKSPYLYEFDLDAGKKADIKGVNLVGVHVSYDTPGTYEVFLRVTDADGAFVLSGIRTLVIRDQSDTGSTGQDGVVSSFDNDSYYNEGWQIGPKASGLDWHSCGSADQIPTGGSGTDDGGGYITHSEYCGSPYIFNDYWYFVAPSKFHGDMSAAFGRNLSFDLASQYSYEYTGNPPFIVLSGAGKHIFLLSGDFPTPVSNWGSYSVAMTASGNNWYVSTSNLLVNSSVVATDADIAEVLSALTSLRILGDFGRNASTGLDNVKLGAGQ